MSQLKLSYFDFPGGRGEPARIALRLAAIEFEDHRIPLADWPRVKVDYPYHQVPVMEVDGQLLTQSDAINRLVGKMANLYPEDNWQAALCDETMDTVDDAITLVVNTFFMEEDDKKRNRAELVTGPLPMFLSGLNKALEASGGDYFADGRLTMADLKVLIWVNGLISGNLDYISTSIVADHGPQLLRHKALIESQLT
ncbi:glutathione S-transferase [Porticoccaceae bacterium]|nr:glutathione S-transferase [Porticoccaceae bacterium]